MRLFLVAALFILLFWPALIILQVWLVVWPIWTSHPCVQQYSSWWCCCISTWCLCSFLFFSAHLQVYYFYFYYYRRRHYYYYYWLLLLLLLFPIFSICLAGATREAAVPKLLAIVLPDVVTIDGRVLCWRYELCKCDLVLCFTDFIVCRVVRSSKLYKK